MCHHACDCAKGFTGYLCEIDIDECESAPCWNDGVCTTKNSNGTETPDFYSCECLPTHNSVDIDHCGVEINECENLNSTTECKNGAYCFQSNLYSNVNSELRVNNLLYPDNPYYQCSCIPGFTGQLCEIDINECESSPCKAGAACSDGIYSYSCNCPSGYSGVNCEFDINECDSFPCKNNALCVNYIGGWECDCTGGGFWAKIKNVFGSKQDDLVCSSVKQLFSGHFRVIFGSKQVLCHSSLFREFLQNPPRTLSVGIDQIFVNSTGFTGKTCEQDLDECSWVVCKNGGSCTNREYGFDCICKFGYFGKFCEVYQNFCRSGPCFENSVCVELRHDATVTEYDVNNQDGWSCECRPGFTGPNCDSDVNECNSDPCLAPGAICTDKLNRYECMG